MGRTIEDIRVADVEKRKIPSKHYVYVIYVTWSDGSTNIIYRRYSRFFDFQSKLMEMFPEEAGTLDPRKRIIPFLPGKKFFGRSHIREVAVKRMHSIAEYCKQLVELPKKISQSKEVVEFFELEPDDIDPPKERKKASVKGDKISMPKALEHYIAVTEYVKQEKGEITLKVGMLVEIVEKTETGWWFVNVEDEQGWVPSTCLEREDGVKEETSQRFEPGEEEQYLCTEDFKPQGNDELGLERGAVVDVVEKNLEGWWVVRYNGREGYVPATYLMKTEAFSMKKPKVVRTSVGGPEIVKTLHDISDLLKEEPKEEPEEKCFTVQELSKILKENKRGSAETEKVYECIENMKSRSLKRGGSVRPPPRVSIKPKKGGEAPTTRKIPPLVHAESFCKEYITIADFSDAVGDGISFKAGEIVKVMEKSEGGWWYIGIGDKEGWAPATYIEESTPRPRSPMLAENKAEKILAEHTDDFSSDSDSDAEESASKRHSGLGALANVLKTKLNKTTAWTPPPVPVKKDYGHSEKEIHGKAISDSKHSIDNQEEKSLPSKKDLIETKHDNVKNIKLESHEAQNKFEPPTPVKKNIPAEEEQSSTDIKSAFGLHLKHVEKGKSKDETVPKSSNIQKTPLRTNQKPPPPPKAPGDKAPLSPVRVKKPAVAIPGKTLEQKTSVSGDSKVHLGSDNVSSSGGELSEMKPDVKGLAGALKAKFESEPVKSTNPPDTNKVTVSANLKQSKFSDATVKPNPVPAKPWQAKADTSKHTGEPKRFGHEGVKKPDMSGRTSSSVTNAFPPAHKTEAKVSENEVVSGGKVSDLASVLKSKLESRQTAGDSIAQSQEHEKQSTNSSTSHIPPKPVINLKPNIGAKPPRPVTPPSPKSQPKSGQPPSAGRSPLSVIENRQSAAKLNEDSVAKLNALLDGKESKELDPKKYSSRPLPPKPDQDTIASKDDCKDARKSSVPNVTSKPVPNLPVKPKVNIELKPEPKQSSAFKKDSDDDLRPAGVAGIASALKAKLEDSSNTGFKVKPDLKVIKPAIQKSKPITAIKPKTEAIISDKNVSNKAVNLDKSSSSVLEANEDLFYAIADFPGENDGEISLTIGVEVKVLEKADCWWYVNYDSKEGWAPSSYLEQVKQAKSAATDKLVLNQSRPVQQKKTVYRTCSDFTAENEGELSFNSGQNVSVLDKPEGGWWYVQIGKLEGWVPESYLEEIIV